MVANNDNFLDSLPNDEMIRAIRHYINEDPEIQKALNLLTEKIAEKYIKETGALSKEDIMEALKTEDVL